MNKLTPQQIVKKLLDPEAAQEEQQKKKEALKKQAAQKPKKEEKKLSYYDVKVECMVPAVLYFKILAEDPNQAIILIKNKPPHSVQYKLPARKEILIKVYDAGSNMMRLIKRLVG